MTTRQTYSLLDWLGDIGGLNDALFIISEIVMNSYTQFLKMSVLLTTLFRFKQGASQSDSRKNKVK